MPTKFAFEFHFAKRVRCLARCRYERIYEPGEERELNSLILANTEEEARRRIIGHEMECGWQVLTIKLIERFPNDGEE